jgi:hypothetical protein
VVEPHQFRKEATASLAEFILSQIFDILSEIRSTAPLQISFSQVKRLFRIVVMLSFRVSKISGRLIQKFSKIAIVVSHQITNIFIKLLKASFRLAWKILVRKEINSLKIFIVHWMESAIEVKVWIIISNA